MWWVYALCSAVFAALTTLLAKIGLEGVNSNLATAIRTVVILLIAWGIVFATGAAEGAALLSRRNILFLVLSGVATGLSWICYFKALQDGEPTTVVAIDKSSLVLTILLLVLFIPGEALTIRKGIGALFIVGGTLIIALK